jgi:hypothetical protein
MDHGTAWQASRRSHPPYRQACFVIKNKLGLKGYACHEPKRKHLIYTPCSSPDPLFVIFCILLFNQTNSLYSTICCRQTVPLVCVPLPSCLFVYLHLPLQVVAREAAIPYHTMRLPSIQVLLAAGFASQVSASCGYGTILQPRAEEGTVKVNTFGYIGAKVSHAAMRHLLKTDLLTRLSDSKRARPTGLLSTRPQMLSAQAEPSNPPST